MCVGGVGGVSVCEGGGRLGGKCVWGGVGWGVSVCGGGGGGVGWGVSVCVGGGGGGGG